MNLQLMKEFNIPHTKMVYLSYDQKLSESITNTAKVFLDKCISDLKNQYGIDLESQDFSSIVDYSSNDAGGL